MKRLTIAFFILRFQYAFGFVFALVVVLFGILIFFHFRETGVPIAGSDRTVDSFKIALVVSILGITAGAVNSFLAKSALRKLAAMQLKE
jgi:hypothetical protein